MDEIVRKALHRAFSLGQTYWQQADSESYAANKRADVTQAKFNTLVEETLSHISARPLPQARLSEEEIIRIANETKTAEPGRDGYVLPVTFARAVLAAARQVAVGEPVAWMRTDEEGVYIHPATYARLSALTKADFVPLYASPSPVGQEEPGCASGGSDGVRVPFDPLNDTQAELDAVTREMDVIYERWPKKEDRPKREELLTPLRARCVEIGQRRYRIAAGVPPSDGGQA